MDFDWQADHTSKATVPNLWQGDQALGDLSSQGTMGNGKSNGDRNDCALVDVDSSQATSKFHIEGVLYAPSAGLVLTGRDNDASWATGGIIARHLSALRWTDGGGLAAIGGKSPPRARRKITIVVCDPTWQASHPATMCIAPQIRLREVVEYNDVEGTQPGYGANILSFARDPAQ
jgi:hypothetical protein